MHLQLRGERIPEPLLETVAAITDHARLRHGDVRHDESARVVRLPITRFPLLKQRRVLGNLHDRDLPIPATVVVRNVVKCEIGDRTSPDLGEEVDLLFGVRLREKEVYACSAAEARGQSCFSVMIEVAQLDIEISDGRE